MADARVDNEGLNKVFAIDFNATPGVETEPEWDKEDSNLYKHAKFELATEGIYPDPDGNYYDGMVGEAVLELIEVFARQGHSGFSAGVVISLFTTLAKFEPLGEITDDPEIWMQVADGIAEYPDGMWQCRRKGSVFSHDGGKTFYDIDLPASPDGSPIIFTAKEHNA